MEKGLKKITAFFLALVMFVCTSGTSAYAEASAISAGITSDWDGVTTENKYVGENFSITFSLSGYWNGGYNANVKVENTGSYVIENWYLSFALNNNLTTIWNAEVVSNENGQYVVKNANWNADIPVGGCAEFGISVNENFAGFPSVYKLLGENTQVQEEAYSVEYILDSDWETGFTARVLLTNRTEETLEDWTLEFDFAREITSIWNGVIESHEGNHYVIKNAGHNANIAAGQTVSFGFNGEKGDAEQKPENCELSKYGEGSGNNEQVGKEDPDEEDPDEDNPVVNLALDTDADGVPDYTEEAFGMNITSPDTDGDGVSDYDEIYKTWTDPIYADTDGDGINDAQDDTDSDGLSNQEELRLGTGATRKDTDNDGLSDGDEVLKYLTNPLVVDTDGDEVSDGREIQLGTDPLVKNASFQVKLTSDDEDTVKVSVDIELKGSQVESLSVEKYEDEFFFPKIMPGYIGGCYDFSVEGGFEKAVISFEFNSSLLSDGKFDPIIYYFNESEQTLEPLETTVSGNVASVTTTHFSKYVLINRTVFEDSFTWQDVWTSTGYTGAEIVLVIDDSGSLGGDYGYDSVNGVFTGGEDPEHQRLAVARDFVDNANVNSKIGIVKFDGVVDDISGGLIECNPEGKERLKNYLQFTYKNSGDYNINGIFDSRGYTYMYGGIEEALNQFSNGSDAVLKVMIVFTDGAAHDKSMHSSVVQAANNKGVKVYTVGLGTNNNSYFESYLKPLAQNTGGIFYMASDADDLAEIYSSINEKIDIETDSDGDGITDYYEDNMVMFNGVTLTLDKNNPDTDNDGVPDGKEVCELNYKYSADKTKVIVTGKVVSNPVVRDTDYDGLKDDADIAPLSGKFVGTMYGYYDVKNAQYTMDFREFFDNKNYYDSSISSSSLIFANTIYNEGAFEYTSGASGKISSISDMLKFHGFEYVENYKLASDYSDDHISEIGLGVQEVTYSGQTKKVLAVVIRGTNGTIEEWSSNFDVGDPATWKSEYHKGFYTAEERIRTYVNDYVRRCVGDTSNLTYWITGHSRAAALSNILAAKLIDEGKEVFAYTYATPSTTISTSRKDAKYNSIFNIMNPRDVISYVPLAAWGFSKFGRDYTLDIGSLGLESMWCYRTGQSSYNALEEGLLNLALSRLASDCAPTWESVFDYAGSQNITDEQYALISERAKRFCKLEERRGFFTNNHKGYKVYPSLAFFFQMGAEALAGSEDEKDNVTELISEFWNSKYAATILSILFDIGFDKSVALPDQLGEFLVGDGHAPATYYVLINDSYMKNAR